MRVHYIDCELEIHHVNWMAGCRHEYYHISKPELFGGVRI
jgi:hypothetical protein